MTFSVTFEEYIKKYPLDLEESCKSFCNAGLGFGGLKDINGIEKFKNLEILDLGYNNIQDLTPILYLENLKNIYLINNNLKGIFKKYNNMTWVEGEELRKLKVLLLASRYVDGLNFREYVYFKKFLPQYM